MSKKIFYPKLEDARRAVCELGFASAGEYRQRYRTDALLPSDPARIYCDEWKGWSDFFRTMSFDRSRRKNKYTTLVSASAAAHRLGIKDCKSYYKFYKQDPLLCRSPDVYYSNEWIDWNSFFRGGYCKYYLSLAEARNASKKLGLTTASTYKEGYKKDALLPPNPPQMYSSEWQGWSDFLCGINTDTIYADIEEAMKAVRELKLTSGAEYKSGYKKDPRLPRLPGHKYFDFWQGWESFLTGPPSGACYPTLAEAKISCLKLGFNDRKDYLEGYKHDPLLPKTPKFEYPDDWRGWSLFLDFDDRLSSYPTIELASIAAQNLGATSFKEYQKLYHQDSRLRALPHTVYTKTWKSWPHFLGREVVAKYKTLSEARKVAGLLGCKTAREYFNTYKRFPGLPCDPNKYYGDWEGWNDFLGLELKKYSSLQEATAAAQAFGFRTGREYKLGRHRDPRLVSNPAGAYPEEWDGWYTFLGRQPPVNKYATFEEASLAARHLGVKTQRDYLQHYKLDPRLAALPQNIYASVWRGWNDFLGIPCEIEPYAHIKDAGAAAQALGFKSSAEYRKGHDADKKLPARPQELYKSKWEGWPFFLGSTPRAYLIYDNFLDAKNAVRSLAITSRREYGKLYKKDLGLPANPQFVFRDDWHGWSGFLLPIKYECLADVKHATKILKIHNSEKYRGIYKKHPPLPAHPERVFKDDWTNWYDFLDIPRPLSYQEASDLVQSLGINSSQNYSQYISKAGNCYLPKRPNETYKRDWRNWYFFLGKSEPFTLEFMSKTHVLWGESITLFMKAALGGSSKESTLCRFVRIFVEKYDLGISPVLFLTNKLVRVSDFKDVLEAEVAKKSRRAFWFAVNEFLDFVLKTQLTLEDDETGEVVSVMGARNSIATVVVEPDQSAFHGESCKPALAYQYVDALRNWLFPKSLKNFSDLKHLQVFDADWIEIDPSKTKLDDDPDCVWKMREGRTLLWNPINWVHVYSLVSVPARGVQIAYNDSGEGDELIPEILDDKLIWTDNNSGFNGVTDRQGFIKYYPDSQFGMHFTSNKTSFLGRGYSVSWVPMEMAYWVVKLRHWQRKFNPVTRPMPWVECVNTNLNEVQRKNKGANFFLFRAFGAEEPAIFSARLAQRLAAGLYYSQPKEISLANMEGAPNIITKYRSKYTPHSMRVSLITAYVMEYGLPIDIVMKISGHASIVMAIYYVRTNAEDLRHRFDEGEKRALRDKAYAVQRLIEQGRIDELKHDLIATDKVLGSLTGEVPPGNYLFRDYGFCPFAGTRCDEGGPLANKTQVRLPVPAGYLGSQNCLRCRHFVSGPAFLGGLLSIGNEISLQAHLQFEHYNSIDERIVDFRIEIDRLDEVEYLASNSGEEYDSSDRSLLEIKVRKLQSELESAAKKLDVYMCDLQASAKLINQCHVLINKQIIEQPGESRSQLIVQSGHELQVAFEEVSYFRQLNEVCLNSEIYQSANCDMAVMTRSQMIDKMMVLNDMQPGLFFIDKVQQVVVGNQVASLLLNRLKTWVKVDALIDGQLCLKDLVGDEQISQLEFQSIFAAKAHAIV